MDIETTSDITTEAAVWYAAAMTSAPCAARGRTPTPLPDGTEAVEEPRLPGVTAGAP